MAAHIYTGLKQTKEILADESKQEHFDKVILPGLVDLDTWASDSWGFWNVLYRYQGKFITKQELQQKVDYYITIAEITWKELGKPADRENWHKAEQDIIELMK